MNHTETIELDSLITSTRDKLQIYPSVFISNLIRLKYEQDSKAITEAGHKPPSLSKWLCFQLKKALT